MQSENLKINLFCLGDSADINTWSNLPYFLSKALIRRGAIVNRINVYPYEYFRYNLYMHLLERWISIRKWLGFDRGYDFFRDRVACHFAGKRIEREAVRALAADLNIFLTFSFSSRRYTATPVIHIGDITYEQYLEESESKKGKHELRFVEREKENLRLASIVCAPSQHCCDFLRSRYRLTNVRRLPLGINLEVDDQIDVNQLLNRKWEAKSILFVGRGIHKRGIDILLRAFEQFNEQYNNSFTLTIVGESRSKLETTNERVHCYEYLSKNKPEELARYLDLLRSATMFVMPMREGPFPGVIREALFSHTPVIVSNIWNEEQKIEHGRNGVLVDEIEPTAFARQMHLLIQNRAQWEQMAKDAHASVQRYSWDQCAKELLEAATDHIHLARTACS